MADKTIGSLPNAASLTDDSSFVCEDSGEAKRVTGKQIKDFAKSGAVEAQLASEKAAKDSATALQDIEEIFNGSPADPTNFEVAAGQSETYIGLIDAADQFVENGMAYRLTVNDESVDVIAYEETIVGLGVTIVGDGSSSFTVTNQNDYDVTGKYEIMANGVRYYSVRSQTNASISTKASELATDAQAAAAQSARNAKNSASNASTSETNAKSEANRAESAADRVASTVGYYATKTDLSAHTDNADIHVTADEKAAWNDSDVFIATYGETTCAEMEAAYQAGKLLVMRNGVVTANLYRRNSESLFVFSTVSSTFTCAEDNWTTSPLASTPSKHASTHASGGTDPITPDSIGAAPASHAEDTAIHLPTVTADDNGKFLCVVNGAWAAVAYPSAEDSTF